MDFIKVFLLMMFCVEGMSFGFVLKLLKELILVRKMLRLWKMYFLKSMIMFGILELMDKYDIYYYDVYIFIK